MCDIVMSAGAWAARRSHLAAGRGCVPAGVRAVFLVLGVLLSMAVNAAAFAADVPGALSGKVGVTPSGAASYSVPVSLPPGTAGMQPKIALTYSSQSGNGHLGVGWSISGLPVIARCGASIIQDGFIDGIEFDADDRFCLNGQRLVPVAGSYGANGTQYRTTFEEFSKIVSYGTAGSGPQKFKLWKKSGEILEFGYSANARAEATGRADVLFWAINRITDRNGNYVDFVYSEDTATGEHHISEIKYTGNLSQGLAPYNRIEFIYEARPDGYTAYQSGSTITVSKRLASVKVWAEATVFRTYTLTYGTGAANRSRITSIKECGTAGQCFPATNFAWNQDGSAELNKVELGTASGLTSTSMNYYKVAASGDFNGDGLTDMYVYYSGSTGRAYPTGSYHNYVWLSNGDGTFQTVQVPSADRVPDWYTTAATGDFNGDGLTDFLLVYVDGYGWASNNPSYPNRVRLSNGDGTFQDIAFAPGESLPSYYRVMTSGDFNGDGLTDFVASYTDSYARASGSASHLDWVMLSNGDGSFSKQVTPAAGQIPAFYKLSSAGDFNGDGLTDFFLVYTDQYGWASNSPSYPNRVRLSNGDGTFSETQIPHTQSLPSYYTIMSSADYNGDGLSDIYISYTSDGRAYGQYYGAAAHPDKVMLSKGDGTFERITVPTSNRIPYLYKVQSTADFNGDGLADLYLTYVDAHGRATGSSSYPDRIFTSKGDGSFDSVSMPASKQLPLYYRVMATGDFDGDGLSDIYGSASYTDGRTYTDGTNWDKLWHSLWTPPDLLETVTNGLGLWSRFHYRPMTDAAVYTKGSGSSYPVQDVMSSRRMVHRVEADNGIGGSNVQTYSYEALRSHLEGMGSLGFEKMTVTDDGTGIVTEQTYSQDWANHSQGLLTNARTIAPDQGAGPVVLSDKTVTWDTAFFNTTDGSRLCFRYSPSSTTVKHDLNGAHISTVTQTTVYDDYGFPTSITSASTGGGQTFTKTTANTYSHGIANWTLGRLTAASVTHQAPGTANKVRASSFTYHATTGQMLSETVEPGHGLSHTKSYVRNGFGVVTSVTETWGSTGTDGIAATSRTSSYTYDAKARFRLSETNPLGHSQTSAYDPVTGLATSMTGPNGLTTTRTYDGFGRLRVETRPDGSKTIHTWLFCWQIVYCPPHAVYMIGSWRSDGTYTQIRKDRLNRTVNEVPRRRKDDGGHVHILTEYDALGRVSRKSEPAFGATPGHWTTVTYDLLGRPLVTTRPDGTTQQVAYSGRIQTSTNELGQTKTVETNAAGWKTRVTDTQGNITAYAYDALGQLTAMSDPAGHTSTIAYDIRGNKTADYDPDKGTWTYRYNALGLLVEQTNARGKRTDITYDVLGRMLTRTDDATGSAPQVASWTYDSAPGAGIGKPHTSASPGYSSATSYDSLGRPASTSQTIAGTVYTASTTYDGHSRIATFTYPSGLTIRNLYGAYGHLLTVENAATGADYWVMNAHDARGNITQFTLGNGVVTNRGYQTNNGRLVSIASVKGATLIQDLALTFDNLGNITSRVDNVHNTSETFLYDTLNRVIQVDTSQNGAAPPTSQQVTLTYDVLGNITSKSDVGSYTYGEVGVGCGAGHAGPHAVTSVSGAKTASYCYDQDGNMVSGDGRTVTYTAFGKPAQITQGPNTIDISYGPDRARFKRVDNTAAGTTTTVYAAGKAYEDITRPGGMNEVKHYIGNFAIVTETATTSTTHYMHHDHLGSTVALSDASGTVSRYMAFDAFGKRREVNWTALAHSAIQAFDTSLTTRGFGAGMAHLSHEMLDPVGLVHMNGRVYDPELGRFLSADPNVQDTTNLQAWNRYSYVLNNPLSYTDPSGFFFKSIFKAVGATFGASCAAAAAAATGGKSATGAQRGALPTVRIQAGTCIKR